MPSSAVSRLATHLSGPLKGSLPRLGQLHHVQLAVPPLRLHSSLARVRGAVNLSLRHSVKNSRFLSQPASQIPGQPSLFSSIFARYELMLMQRPLLTKSVTSGVLYGIGDCIGQAIERRNKPPSEGRAFDWGRLSRSMAFGGIFYPGIAHLHYNFLEWLVVVKWATPISRIPFIKMFIEQFVYWSYFSNAYYHAVLGMLQGMTFAQVQDRVTSTLWDTLKAQWAFWIPAQLINFRYVPVRHQLNFVLVVSLAWTTFLSLAFPPAKVHKDE